MVKRKIQWDEVTKLAIAAAAAAAALIEALAKIH